MLLSLSLIVCCRCGGIWLQVLHRLAPKPQLPVVSRLTADEVFRVRQVVYRCLWSWTLAALQAVYVWCRLPIWCTLLGYCCRLYCLRACQACDGSSGWKPDTIPVGCSCDSVCEVSNERAVTGNSDMLASS